ncbi:MAG: hypothetical protein CEO22_541 [Candidatus Berkelbacteria bacterium Gr01-1014_85]|uniref:Type IV pilus assembly protein PilO n=1 Tax=Candidatus Berkelbacteria bacterium Gr01-1014_85 TaxID=2017150 RepID=A0A554JA68_9BACT|nr:MAG: hypothetical protein CEO22_541 [Candidatus Berkelbacteria bacterium Gr01-1014_85]
MNKTSNQAWIVLAAASLAIALLVFLTTQSWPKYNQTKNELKAERLEQAENQALLKLASSLEAANATQPALITKLQVALGAEAKPESAAVVIEAIAKQSGLALAGLTPNPINGDRLPISLSARGNYLAISQFLGQLKSSVRLIQVDSLAIVPSSDRDRSLLTLSATLSLPIFTTTETALTSGSLSAELPSVLIQELQTRQSSPQNSSTTSTATVGKADPFGLN